MYHLHGYLMGTLSPSTERFAKWQAQTWHLALMLSFDTITSTLGECTVVLPILWL